MKDLTLRLDALLYDEMKQRKGGHAIAYEDEAPRTPHIYKKLFYSFLQFFLLISPSYSTLGVYLYDIASQ